MILVDANVLIYAINESSPQHEPARNWMEASLNGTETIGFDPIVLLAFVRIVTNPRIFPNPLTTDVALSLVQDWLSHPGAVSVTPGAGHWTILGELLSRSGAAGNLVNDAHLASLALEHGARLASFDADFNRFGIDWVMPS